ncbi:Hypothetical protein P9515_12561 [Prochlorococcus marinus str. MIT 9515]|uniref:Uncharacterized protein n=1 Tax=Prochlorococcus marinus (strain MIT 9515) TaxID=167542 RepID=A2BXF2_PROM5|nr:hypothetical protein [Prochlorococcus marinus]ABM72463.1 Hypothetical protein P9515_12561 [Prochlorococcus marinus str. MIT 9515]
MKNSKNKLNSQNKESERTRGGSTSQDSLDENKSSAKEYLKKVQIKERFHLNSLITKNISLFTKNPNYKMLAWLIVQLIIFSLFIFAVNIFKKNLIPYFNS